MPFERNHLFITFKVPSFLKMLKGHRVLLSIFFLSSCLIAQEKRTFYYDNGNVESHGHLVNGKKEGVWKYYYESGKVKKRGIYKSGIKDGSWVYHDKDGERDYYIEYVEGDKIFRQSFKFKYDRIYFDRFQPDSVPN